MNASTAQDRPFRNIVNEYPNWNWDILWNAPPEDIGGFKTWQAAYGYIRSQANRPGRVDKYGQWLTAYDGMTLCHDGIEKRGDVYVIKSLMWK